MLAAERSLPNMCRIGFELRDMNTTPFSLRIFVADGLRIVDKSNWIGKALMFPRALLPHGKVYSCK
jgi:hypothetical protein